MVAETSPFPSAVKKDEAKMLNPEMRNEMENSLNPLQVSSNNS